MVKVTNISKTTRVLYDKGKQVVLEAGESAEMVNAPSNHYAFKVGNHIEKKDKKEEQKVERRDE